MLNSVYVPAVAHRFSCCFGFTKYVHWIVSYKYVKRVGKIHFDKLIAVICMLHFRFTDNWRPKFGPALASMILYIYVYIYTYTFMYLSVCPRLSAIPQDQFSADRARIFNFLVKIVLSLILRSL